MQRGLIISLVAGVVFAAMASGAWAVKEREEPRLEYSPEHLFSYTFSYTATSISVISVRELSQQSRITCSVSFPRRWQQDLPPFVS